jgi:predicted ATPase/predicted nuclease of restriction endonuclease-like (RecB) superfamily
MKDLLNKLFAKVTELIESDELKGNKLRYQLGEVITAFYTANKEEIRKGEKDIEREILELYESENLNKNNIVTGRYKASAWDKMKIALSEALIARYDADGYSVTNLAYMQQFYRKYRNSPDSLEDALQLDWSHNISLLKDKLTGDERRFYLKKAVSEGWTVKKLEQKIRDEAYDVFLRTIEDCDYKYKIEKIEINNYKSLVNFKLDSPSQFLVFAGANATGKSSIFEAIEFLMHSAMTTDNIAIDIFGGADKIVNYQAQIKSSSVRPVLLIILNLSFGDERKQTISFGINYDYSTNKLFKQFTGIASLDRRIVESFSHIFIDNRNRAENKIKLYNKLWLDASNTSRILKTILENSKKRPEVIEWLQILIPGLEKISVEKDLSGKEELQVFEKAFPNRPFTGNLISEGTYNIIALLTLIYQSDEPQFICIEEPETGLNPAVLKEMVPFFREMAQKYHHHIWVTTHSVSLVSELVEEELVIVNKKDGITHVYPCQPGDFEEMNPGEAWMSNMLKGGGLPW